MPLPAWLTVHVMGYGGAAILLVGTGGVLLHEHDNRIKAEMHAEDVAKSNQRADSIVIAQNNAAVVQAGARVETVTVRLQPQLIRETHTIDSASKFIHDTILVKQALDSARATIAACTELVLTCDQFRRMATDSLRSLGNLLAQRDHEMLVAVTPPRPWFSHGLELGAGACAVGRKIGGKTSVFGAPCASLTYGVQIRLGR